MAERLVMPIMSAEPAVLRCLAEDKSGELLETISCDGLWSPLRTRLPLDMFSLLSAVF